MSWEFFNVVTIDRSYTNFGDETYILYMNTSFTLWNTQISIYHARAHTHTQYHEQWLLWIVSICEPHKDNFVPDNSDGVKASIVFNVLRKVNVCKTNTDTQTHAYTHTNTCVHTHKHMRTHTHTCTNTRTHICTHAHTHTYWLLFEWFILWSKRHSGIN